MNAEQWREVKSVLQQAMNTPVTQRRAFLESACGEQPELLHQVESLLAAHDDEMASGDPLRRIVEARDRAMAISIGTLSDDELRILLQTGLGDQYDVLGTLGSGGMGSVFLAHERALGRTVAIKVLRPDRASTPGGRERFRREARIAAQLSHPGIVPLYSFGEVNGLWYFVMEYVRGASLAQRLDNEHRLQPDEVRSLLLAIAEALEHAHQRGVVHRDIKPANILLDEESGRPRLADFGISKMEGWADSATITGTYLGTPLFMSPEQGNGDADVDGRSDIYSLGAVAYAMLTGRAPFVGTDAIDMLSRRRTEDPMPILEVAPKVPADLANVVMRCLQRDCEARWRDATTLRLALSSSGNTRSSALPEAIVDLPGYAAYAMIWLVSWVAVAFSTVRSPTSRYLLILIAILVPVGPALHIWRVRAHGMGVGQLLRIVVRPPKWWGTWWPARLRSTDDLWTRLPFIARAVRVYVAVFFVLLAIAAFATDGHGTSVQVMRNTAIILLIVVTPLAFALTYGWAVREKLNFDRTMQFLFASTSPSSFWQEPPVKRLLETPTPSVKPPDAARPSDYTRAVEELIRRFPAIFEPIGHIVLPAVRQQIVAMAKVDREIALLARDASPADDNRRIMRLNMLAESEASSPELRELGDALRREIEVMRKLQGQQTLAIARRDALAAQLRAVWTLLTSILDAEREGEVALRGAEQRLRELCQRLQGEGEIADGASRTVPR